MSILRLIVMVIVAAVIMVVEAYAAATPSIRNTEMETISAAAGLEREFDATADRIDDAAWIGYAVPMRGGYMMCCGDYRCRDCVCRLEREHSFYMNSDDCDDEEILADRDAFVLFRVEEGRVGRIRTYSEDCKLDAGGLTLYWLTDVEPQESIDLLARYATAQKGSRRMREKVSERAVSAIAVHDHPAALDALEAFVDPDQPEWLREKSVFWVGNSGGRRGVDILSRVLRDDPSSDVREQAVFALTLPDMPEATELLIRIARRDRDPDVRSNALFWLANEAGERAKEAIVNAIEDDPDTDVKEQAVFALSQLPNDEGVPLLIHVARTNRNPEVREQAIFWLGQSGDDRALDFFEEILSN